MIARPSFLLLLFLLTACQAPPVEAGDTAGPGAEPALGPAGPAGASQPAPPAVPQAVPQVAPDPARPLVLEEALALAFVRSTGPEAAAARAAAARFRADAAGRLPEPSLAGGVEAWPLRSPREGEEWWIGLFQEIPLGGEGAAARGLAEAEHQLALRRLEAARLELEVLVRGDFARALAAQEAVALHAARGAATRRLADLAEARVQRGDALPAEAAAARAVRAAAEESLAAARASEAGARAVLAARLGSAAQELGAVQGDLVAVLDLVAVEEILADDAAPALAAARAAAEVAEWRARLAQAARVPAVELGLGYRRTGDGRDAVDAQFGIGLPIQGRRGAEARAARAEARAARLEAEQAGRDRAAGLHAALAACRAASAWLRLQDEVLVPAARTEFSVLAARVDAGDLPLGARLHAEEQLARLELDRLDALAALLAAWNGLREELAVDG